MASQIFETTAGAVAIGSYPSYLGLSGWSYSARWSYLGLSGAIQAIWSYLGLSDTIWRYLVLSGAMWRYLGLCEAI